MYKETEINKARKQHYCSCCERPINIGERYINTVELDSCGLYTYKVCPECNHVLCEFIDRYANANSPFTCYALEIHIDLFLDEFYINPRDFGKTTRERVMKLIEHQETIERGINIFNNICSDPRCWDPKHYDLATDRRYRKRLIRIGNYLSKLP